MTNSSQRIARIKLFQIWITAIFAAIVFLLLPAVGNSFIRNVGQGAVFMWNRTSPSIFEAQWGLYDYRHQVIRPSFIYINKFVNRPILSNDLDTSAASRYKGRVFWMGDLSAGRAWYKITNLNINDTNQYVVRLQDGNAVDTTYKMDLVVAAPPQFSLQLPLTKIIAEGQDLILPCTAIGPPTPNVTWVHGHVTKSTGTGSATLRIPNIRRDQNGTYECRAWNNPNERPVTRKMVVIVHYPPQSTVLTSSVTVVQGDSIVLRCTADGSPPPSISWTKADGVIKTGHTVAGGTLRIPDAIKTDAGKYICTAKNTYDSRQHTDNVSATVVVKYQPSILLGNLKDETLNESYSLHIKCEADGYPPPTIKWKTPTGSVHTGNVYNIPSVSRSHAGTYTCTASNGIGTDAMASIQVTVQFKPFIDKSLSSSQADSWNGKHIRLRCVASGLPTPQISWYKPTGDKIVPGGSEVTVLKTADQGDYGQYKCRATNILGSDEHVINVTQLSPPGPVSITVTAIEASSITVRWAKPSDNGGRNVTGYLLETDSHISVQTIETYTVLTSLQKDTQYRITVYAKNDIGYGVPSRKIITTKATGRPQIPRLLTALLLEAGSKIRVLLRWTKPEDNGGQISRYTIYTKEVKEHSDWTKTEDVIDPRPLESIVQKTLEYGKTYKFIITAWNKYGESIKDERNARTVNTTDKTSYVIGKPVNESCVEENPKYVTTVLGVIIAILVISIGLNLLQCLRSRRKGKLNCRKQKPLNKRSKTNKAAAEETYDNDLEMDERVATAVTALPQPRANTGPEYETIPEQNDIASPQEAFTVNPPRHYEDLNLPPSASQQDVQSPIYEHLRERAVDSKAHSVDQETHSYQALTAGKQTYYHSLHSKGESVI